MRTLNKNKQNLQYSLPQERKPIYATDKNGELIVDFVDEEGNIYYRETGEYTSGWSKPDVFYANISQSGGEAEAREFGLSVADYDAVIVAEKNKLPLVLGSLVWQNSEVLFEKGMIDNPDEKSADYTVMRISDSLNITKYVLKAVIK